MDSCEASVCAQRLTFPRISFVRKYVGRTKAASSTIDVSGLFAVPEACRYRDSPTAILETAEDFMASAAHDLLGRALTIQDVIGGLLRLRGSDYHHPLIAMQRRQPALN